MNFLDFIDKSYHLSIEDFYDLPQERQERIEEEYKLIKEKNQ